MKVVITGISGTLGQALGREYKTRGWHVVGVSRQRELQGEYFDELLSLEQNSIDDAQALMRIKPDLIILNAGQIETDIGPFGEPLSHVSQSMNMVNYEWPSLVALAAAESNSTKNLDIIAIGSIADGSPSCFGPVYHAGKIALHYFWAGVGPIIYQKSNRSIRLRLYRPGAINGPLAWAPVNRLNERGTKVRAKRVESAPSAEKVARRIADWIDSGKQWVGTYEEPISFRFLKVLHALVPNLYYKLQLLAWRKASKFVE